MNFYESYKKSKSWYRLTDLAVETTQSGFLMAKNNFFFQVIDTVLQKFLQAGIIDFLITERIQPGMQLAVVKEPLMLTINDLNFGFIIWLGFCGASILGFFVEILFFILKKKFKKPKLIKVKPAKVHSEISIILSIQKKGGRG
ncbi:hypothetical protein ACKWTF_016505 [Chironomus riparius]